MKKVEEKIEEKIISDLKKVLSNTDGRRVFQYILTMKPKVDFIINNERATAFNLGQSSIIDAIYKLIKSSNRDNIFKMEDEYTSFIRSYDKEYEEQDKQKEII
jgi:multidrug efflux pump subunit AcrB